MKLTYVYATMKKYLARKGKIPVFVTVTFLLFAYAPPSSHLRTFSQEPLRIGPRDKFQDWTKYEISGIPYEVALEWFMGTKNVRGSTRVLFVYLEQKHFSRDNLFLVVGHLSSKIPQPVFINVTLLTDRGLLRKRVANYSGWIVSNETSYTRLTVESDTCCPQGFTGAQFDRYPDEGKFVICTEGKPAEISVDYKSRK